MTEQSIHELVDEYERRLAEFKSTPGWGKMYKAPKLDEAFWKLAGADPGLAFDVCTRDPAEWHRACARLPRLLKHFRGTPKRLAAFDRIKSMASGRDEASLMMRIAAAFPDRSKVRRAALDRVVEMADETDDWLWRARFCATHLANLKEISPEHGTRLAGTIARGAEDCPINCDSDYKVAYDLAAQLSQGNTLLDVRDEISKRLRRYERLTKLQKELDGLNSAIATARKNLAAAPATDEDFQRELEELMRYTVTVRDEDDGEWHAQPAFDGERLCIGDGDDMAEFWGSFGVLVDALQELMSAVDLEETPVDWSKCPTVLPAQFAELAEDLAYQNSSLERYLDENNLADVDYDDWDGGAPGCSGAWVRVWVPIDQVVPLLRDLWAGYRYAASVIIPALEERVRDLVN